MGPPQMGGQWLEVTQLEYFNNSAPMNMHYFVQGGITRYYWQHTWQSGNTTPGVATTGPPTVTPGAPTASTLNGAFAPNSATPTPALNTAIAGSAPAPPTTVLGPVLAGPSTPTTATDNVNWIAAVQTTQPFSQQTTTTNTTVNVNFSVNTAGSLADPVVAARMNSRVNFISTSLVANGANVTGSGIVPNLPPTTVANSANNVTMTSTTTTTTTVTTTTWTVTNTVFSQYYFIHPR